MDGTETEFAQQLGKWLSAQLGQQHRRWSGADLRRAIEAVGGKVGATQVSRWLNGEQRPTVKSAGWVADALGVDRRVARSVAGLSDDVGAEEGPIVVVDDPAEVFVARVRARGFPPAVEERLIEQVRRDIAERRAALDAQMDTVEEAQRAVRGDTDAA
jgi:hypothetical protein